MNTNARARKNDGNVGYSLIRSCTDRIKPAALGAHRTEEHASRQGHANATDLRLFNRLSWSLLVTSGLIFTNFLREGSQLRFTIWWVNALLIALACLSPAVVVVARLVAPYTRAKWWVVGGLTPVALVSGCFLLGLLAFNSAPPTRIASISLGTPSPTTPTIRCFYNSEFMGSSIDVQREQQILPGLVWSTPLYHQGSGVGVTIRLIDRDHLQCDFSVDEDIDGGYAHKSVTIPIR